MSSENLELTIGWLYPKLMSTYGDRGNVITIERRALWRGYNARVIAIDQKATAADIKSVDIIVGGGAQDRQQEIVMRDLQGAKADAMGEKIENGTPGVFTCGSPQLLGKYYEPALGQRIQGLGILDLVSVHPGENTKRCIGNLVVEVTAPRLEEELQAMTGTKPYLVGFENHGGRTQLGKVEALGRVVYGLGNNGEDGTEGAFYQNAIATYSHGPLLPKNPFVADWLIQTALRLKYQEAITLSALDDNLALQARGAMLKRLKVTLPSTTAQVEKKLEWQG
ncbi:type 1 glutamine amidotransferase [Umezakia ovalisporum]|jgi:CobQ-like glutamine amidotransferase family enzyme|uniref:Lipid II isoglutaminyl synthase (glutamine-hydrolyzing) subunit GatD n=1 Tax=Umezakia ovalisporum FSS-62 TaxID=2971776 RepID=A0AA43H0K4_9CYAN|nr:type 1 glutamine amidotransferase [Umezakia ovalisporum]MDH6064712.1 type 1 glutamine amidotransferase [Umezakia ovalisporum FSS-62]MDH6066683.1 type 1 glutamine amidotransferase [Umezakia ovalisporum APH033B]MDH6073522.1 type 1 glutamine amidotransferase [Umezakia ovalisporum CS-1034]MDH6088861.1 type 1 glutamine amidotransferase [Umezakia ovalisporum Ak1311]CEJ44106.1 CobB/CobQ domain protein glutamine amidotransfera se [Umezakia ovalisporum]